MDIFSACKTGGGNDEPDLYRKSPRVAAMKPSATAAMTDKSIELRQAGQDVLALSVGEPDFDPPQAVIDATIAAVTKGDGALKTRYTSVQGTLELRTKIAEYLTEEKKVPTTPAEVLVCNGGKQCLIQAIMAMTGPGDEVLVPGPFWVSYTEQCTLAGSTSTLIRTSPVRQRSRFFHCLAFASWFHCLSFSRPFPLPKGGPLPTTGLRLPARPGGARGAHQPRDPDADHLQPVEPDRRGLPAGAPGGLGRGAPEAPARPRDRG
eukprot:SAG22_NODE_1865_length_3410_cov_2.241921_4_plen_263_part_00